MDLLKYRTEENKSEESLMMFKETVASLEKFAIFLNVSQGEDQKMVNGLHLAGVSKEFLSRNEYVWFDINEVYHKFKQELQKRNNGNEVDVNRTVLHLLSKCLLYIINMLQDENANIREIYKNFLVLNKCIVVFTTSTVILDTKVFSNLVICWIFDLLKIITGADGTIPCQKHLRVFNVIRKIVTTLARHNSFTDLISREIVKKFECALSYYAANEEFSYYIASRTVVFEYLLWIMMSVVNDSIRRGYRMDDVLSMRIRQTLESLAKCLDGKCSSAITDLIIEILMIL